MNRSVTAAERTLHTGPGRDVALEEGVYANEARAKLYMAAGRAAAGRMSELKNAAATEAYIERKIKQKFPNDPVLVSRVMQIARNKIAYAVAHGFDFTQPRVVDRKELEKHSKSRIPINTKTHKLRKTQTKSRSKIMKRQKHTVSVDDSEK